jgi:serine/threonine-protein kinase
MKPGDLIGGKYRLVRQIGEGAMGVVWSAVHELTTREVALKLVLRSSDDLRHRLLREARACGSLSHRNIIEVYDVGQTSTGDPFLVMPLLSGETLAELLARQRRLDPPVVAQIGRDVARALAAAHAAQIIHRDLKPANIFLHREAGTEGNIVKVLDFGVSKNLGATDIVATVAGGLVGSPAYMSPEQIRVDPNLDHRTDIWSFGVILFEMLTGVRPFQGTPQEIVNKILTAELPPVSRFVRFVEPSLVELVARCLERDRSRRIASAADIAQMLQGHASSESSRVHVGLPGGAPAGSSNVPASATPLPTSGGASPTFAAPAAQPPPPRAAAASQPAFPAVTAPSQAAEARTGFGAAAPQSAPQPHAFSQSSPNWPAAAAPVQAPEARTGFGAPGDPPSGISDPRSQAASSPTTNPGIGALPPGTPPVGPMPPAATALLPNIPGAPWVPMPQPGAAAVSSLPTHPASLGPGPQVSAAPRDSGDFTRGGTLRMGAQEAAAAAAAVRRARESAGSTTTSTAAVVQSPGPSTWAAAPASGTPPDASAESARKKRVAVMIAALSALVTLAGGGLVWFVVGPKVRTSAGTEAPAKSPEAPLQVPVAPPPPGTEQPVQPPAAAELAVPPAASIEPPVPPAPGQLAPKPSTLPISPPAPARPPVSVGSPPVRPTPAAPTDKAAPASKPPCKATFLKKCP